MQGIYNCIPETNHAAKVCSVASVLWLQFMPRVMLCRMLDMLCTFTLVLSEVCVCVCVCVRSAQYGCFLYFVELMLSRNVFSELF